MNFILMKFVFILNFQLKSSELGTAQPQLVFFFFNHSISEIYFKVVGRRQLSRGVMIDLPFRMIQLYAKRVWEISQNFCQHVLHISVWWAPSLPSPLSQRLINFSQPSLSFSLTSSNISPLPDLSSPVLKHT